jgi:PEP-CTERM/exosortase A-associated glycosyltransferase
MRILHVLDHSIPLHSGYTFRTRAILEHQRARGWETFHLTSAKQGNLRGVDEEEVDGFTFFRSSPPVRWLADLPLFNQWAVVKTLERRMRKVAAEVRPDVIHAHSPALNGLAALRVARDMNIPLVYEIRAFWEDAAVDHGTSTEWGARYRMTRALETYVVRKADAVTVICEGLKQDVVKRGVRGSRVTVIPNAVDAERFAFDADRDDLLAKRMGLDGQTVLGFIGSFYAYEGLDLLVSALPRIRERRADVKLLLVGGGPEEEKLKAQVRSMGLSQRVQFAGRIPHDEVQRYYSLVDMLVYPRYSMRLTELVTPLKPLEAMAQGKLLVASDVGGHRELIRPGETGDLFCAGDAEGLAKTVTRLLDNPASWEERRNLGRRFVEEERNWSVSVGRYAPIYEKCAKTK